MLFDKQKENLSDQQAVYQQRKAPRYSLKAGISIEGFEGEGMLGNISISGCCMESSTFVSIIPGEQYQVTVIPGQDENIRPFSQKFVASWTKSSEMLFQAGFSLESGQSNTQMKQYVDLLTSRGVPPDYGNMNRNDRHA